MHFVNFFERRKYMKQRLKRILALVLTFSMVAPTQMLPVNAADGSSNIIFTEEETIPVSNLGEERSALFNSDWKFFLGNSASAHEVGFNDSSWRTVDLPHDYSIEQEFTTSGEAESGFLPGGTGWYRKSFTLPQECEGKNITLDFNGVYMNATVYVNGRELGTHPYGYTGFAFDISEDVICDGRTQNVIAVKVENTLPSSRWYSGSGIYRDVYFNITDQIHVARYGTTITTPDLEEQQDGDVSVNIETTVENDGTLSESVTVRNTVYDSEGNPVSEPVEEDVTVDSENAQSLSQTAIVNNPDLWSVESPTLYYVKTEILKDSQVIDTYESEFGFRYFHMDTETGFSLNGENLKLKGVCMHHDQGALGAEAHEDAIERQIKILKEMGCNSIRVTHNPASDVLVRLCDKYGMLMIDEAFDTWLYPKNGNVNDYGIHFDESIGTENEIIGGESNMTWAEYDLKEMVSRGKNSPSIIMWSLGNEIMEGNSGDFSIYSDIARQLITWGKEIDDTRYYTFGDNKLKANWAEAFEISDVLTEEGGTVGANYCGNSLYNSIHNNHPDYALYGSETASAIGSRGVYHTKGQNNSTRELTAYDKTAVGWGATASSAWFDVIRNDFIAGTYVWTGFDYIGEPTPWNGTGTGSVTGGSPSPRSSYFGIVDTAGFPKDDYYLYQSLWNEDVHTLHVLPCWDEENIVLTNGEAEVVVYTDAASVELYLNNKKVAEADSTVVTTGAGYSYRMWQGKNNASGLYPTFYIPYERGTLSVKAYDDNGELITDTVGRSSVTTSSTPSRLELTDTYSYGDYSTIDADGYSLSYISVDVTDDFGVMDPDASNEITFTVEGDGELVGTDNGDQRDLTCFVPESTKQTTRKAYNGKALAIVKSTKKAGSFTLTASADGLLSDRITVTTESIYEDGNRELQSYQLPTHCYVRQGANSLALPQTVTATYADGEEADLPITWDSYDADNLNRPESFVVTGSFQSGEQEVSVSMTVHVYGNVVAAENYSGITAPSTMPTLPSVLQTYLGDGQAYEEFPVVWDTSEISAEDFANVGEIVEISGLVTTSFNETYPVTASIRVAEPILGEKDNIAPDYLELTQSCTTTTDNLLSIVNGVKQSSVSGGQNERWSNWNMRNDPSSPVITFTWATAHLVDQINLFYYKEEGVSNSQYPTSVSFEYSLNGQDWHPVSYDASNVEEIENEGRIFHLNEMINPIAIRIILGHDVGSFIGLTEVEIMSTSVSYSANASADLSGIEIDNAPLEGFSADTLEYSVSGTEVTGVTADANAAYTVLPLYGNTVRILTKSEDRTAGKTYALTFDNLDPAISYLSKVEVTAPTDTMAKDDTLQLAAKALNQDGEDITDSCQITYQVEGSASCTESGLVTATESGLVQAIATATYKGKTISSDPFTIRVNGADLPIEGLTGSADSEETTESMHPASNAVDGNVETYWHSNWTNNDVVIDPENPDNCQNNGYTIDLGQTCEVTKLEYLPRQQSGAGDGFENGRILKYRILAGTSPDSLTVISQGSWDNDESLKAVRFEPVQARYLRIEALSTYTGATESENQNQYISAAEFYVYAPGQPECICEIRDLTFEGESVTIPYYEENMQIPLEATASLRDGCIVEGHENASLVFTYAIEKDESQIAELTGSTLTLSGSGTVTVKATAKAVGAEGQVIMEESVTADFTSVKEAVPEYTVSFEGGEDAMGSAPASITAPIGTPFYLPENTFVRKGYEFVGWSNGVSIYPENTLLTIGSRDITFTAVWEIVQVPSEKIENITGRAESWQTTQPASNALDNNVNTHWHSNWTNNNVVIDPDDPDACQNNGFIIDLGDTYPVTKVEYLPRQYTGPNDGCENGRIINYRILAGTSEDSMSVVCTGTWENDYSLKTAAFETVTARYIRIEALSTYSVEANGANKYINAAEFYVYRSLEGFQSQELREWIAFAESLSAEEYTSESWAIFEEALQAARLVDADANASKAEIDQAITNLIAAFGGLEYGVQKQHLQEAIKAAESILDLEQDYDEESLAALKALIEDAKEMLTDVTATQDAVNEMVGNLIDAIVQVAPDKELAALESLIEAVESLDGSKYTSDSWAVLEEAVAAAKDVLADPDRAEGALSEAYLNLAEAIRSLVMKGNKAALTAVIEKAEEILANSSSYTESTISGLTAALDAAKSVYENENASQPEVNKAVEDLTAVLAQARLKGDLNQDGAVTTKDSTALLRYAAELDVLEEGALEGADVNGDGIADTRDAVLILQYASEKKTTF